MVTDGTCSLTTHWSSKMLSFLSGKDSNLFPELPQWIMVRKKYLSISSILDGFFNSSLRRFNKIFLYFCTSQNFLTTNVQLCVYTVKGFALKKMKLM